MTIRVSDIYGKRVSDPLPRLTSIVAVRVEADARDRFLMASPRSKGLMHSGHPFSGQRCCRRLPGRARSRAFYGDDRQPLCDSKLRSHLS